MRLLIGAVLGFVVSAADVTIRAGGAVDTDLKANVNTFMQRNIKQFRPAEDVSTAVSLVDKAPTASAMQGSSKTSARIGLFEKRPTEAMMQEYMGSFQASDPTYQEWCSSKLFGNASEGIGSQFGQDMFLFHNLFAAKTLRGEKGFYVDSGANHWSELSNTLFFDKCLGWDGLCAEPNSEYHQGIKDHRSCTLVPECLSNEESDMGFNSAGPVSSVQKDGGGGTTVHCRPLKAMLAQVGSPKVDLWSLDVEGFEMTVLNSGIEFTQIPVILMENFWISTRLSDRFLNEQGYVKLYQMDIDGLFVRLDDTVWRPSSDKWEETWKAQEQFRNDFRAKLAADQ